ncbi:NAD-dependent epimerase/dehydratase family protein [Streptomyces massasporeus]|uniref:NAD-dependent epimerase/dehydratase family protein n=1 Tax=Streptomyces massasporeus TaxID=67324 RepID=UPI0033C3CF9F
MVVTTNHTSQSILLAGASGVLGRHTAHALTEAGHKVTGRTRLEAALRVERRGPRRDAVGEPSPSPRAVGGTRWGGHVLGMSARPT